MNGFRKEKKSTYQTNYKVWNFEKLLLQTTRSDKAKSTFAKTQVENKFPPLVKHYLL
jgi:hypothetical protein